MSHLRQELKRLKVELRQAKKLSNQQLELVTVNTECEKHIQELHTQNSEAKERESTLRQQLTELSYQYDHLKTNSEGTSTEKYKKREREISQGSATRVTTLKHPKDV